MDQAAIFLAGTVLTVLGFLTIIIAIVIVNNVLHKYWKPVNLFHYTPKWWQDPPARFLSPEEAEKVAPHLDPVSKEPMAVIDDKQSK